MESLKIQLTDELTVIAQFDPEEKDETIYVFNDADLAPLTDFTKEHREKICISVAMRLVELGRFPEVVDAVVQKMENHGS